MNNTRDTRDNPAPMPINLTVDAVTAKVELDQSNITLGPVYEVLLPLARYLSADLKDWLNNNPDDSDAVDVRTIVERAISELEGLDTTVRESY